MENDRHVVLIVGGIEPRHIDQGSTQAVPEVCSVQGRLSVFRKEDGLALPISCGDIADVLRCDWVRPEQHGPQKRQEADAGHLLHPRTRRHHVGRVYVSNVCREVVYIWGVGLSWLGRQAKSLGRRTPATMDGRSILSIRRVDGSSERATRCFDIECVGEDTCWSEVSRSLSPLWT